MDKGQGSKRPGWWQTPDSREGACFYLGILWKGLRDETREENYNPQRWAGNSLKFHMDDIEKALKMWCIDYFHFNEYFEMGMKLRERVWL